MNMNISKIVAIVFSLVAYSGIGFAQNSSKIVLLRDSLDFNSKQLGLNTNSNEFNPMPYKGGLLFVSNKKTSTNPIGFNKVYWISKANFGKALFNDSLRKNLLLNDEFTAPTSNDNDILTHYTRGRAKKILNAVEQDFADFNPDQSFSFNDSSKIIIYSKLSKLKINGVKRWELWEAVLHNGRTSNNHRIKIIDSAADYLYPYLNENASRLYFASNRANGLGGFDIYSIDKVDGVWQNIPNNITEVNTSFNEIFPVAKPDTLMYASDRVGGLGGYDLYQYINSAKKSKNFGYPINTSNDDIAFGKDGNDFYLTSNRSGSLDVLSYNYSPVTIYMTGKMTYLSDGQLVPNHKFYIFDKDENILVDSLMTDNDANYIFHAKPNRSYEIATLNTDGILEKISIRTNDQLSQQSSIALHLNGRSPKQIKDSIYNAMVMAEKNRTDSINASLGISSKYVVYYGFDKAQLSFNEKKTLDVLISKLKNNLSTYLVVGAFTDCIGSDKYNNKLSIRRAQNVVQYLKSKGIGKDKFVLNGYAKSYAIAPCDPTSNKNKQQINRRAEVVLSETKNTNWANLENERGKNFYATVYSSINKNLPSLSPSLKLQQALQVKSVNFSSEVKMPVKQVIDSVKTETVRMTSRRPNTAKGPMLDKKATEEVKEVKEIKEVKVETKPAPQTQPEPKVIVAKASEYNNDNAKEDILKALDSLASLKKEQERIIDYMTKRINKKPIDVFVSSDSVSIEIYDNGIHDNDSVSIIFNNRIIVDKQELKVRKPISFKLKVDKNKKYNELVMVAENLGSEPPNTAVMFVTEKSGRRQQVMLATDMTHNEVVYFIRIGKE